MSKEFSGSVSEIEPSNASNRAVNLETALSEPLAAHAAPSSTPTVSRHDRTTAEPGRRSRRQRRADDRDAIVAIYDEHYAGLVRFAYLVAPDPSQAEDLVHEAFVKLYSAWRRIDDPARVGGYLRTTVLNLARGRARHLGVIRRNRPEPRPDAASAESRAMLEAERDRVVVALRQLSSRQRACLVLRHYEDRTESEIASILDISIGSVRTHIHRGMQSLTSILAEEPSR